MSVAYRSGSLLGLCLQSSDKTCRCRICGDHRLCSSHSRTQSHQGEGRFVSWYLDPEKKILLFYAVLYNQSKTQDYRRLNDKTTRDAARVCQWYNITDHEFPEE